MLINVMAYLVGIMITAPVLVTWCVYAAATRIYKHKWKAIHAAVNWTAILYILAVFTILELIVGHSFIGIILIVLMSLFAVIIIMQWKWFTEVVFQKAFKVFWRCCFLLFAGLYVLLMMAGIVQQFV